MMHMYDAYVCMWSEEGGCIRDLLWEGAYMIMEPEKSHNLLSKIWRPGKPYGVVVHLHPSPKSESQRSQW